MAEPRLDWSTAEVKDHELTVQIAGDPPDGWKDSFNSTAALLGGRDFGQVELRKGAAHVEAVTEGDEERVRHFLESIVQQANAAHKLEDEQDGEDAEEGGAGDSSASDEMTERFRSFAAEDEPA